MVREYTAPEVQNLFLSEIQEIIDTWEHYPDKSVRERMEGVAFSILAIIDGEGGDMPAFILAPAPHPDDKEFCQSREKDWFPETEDVKANISGNLHELFAKGKIKRD